MPKIVKNTFITIFFSGIFSAVVSLVSLEIKKSHERGEFLEWQKNVNISISEIEKNSIKIETTKDSNNEQIREIQLTISRMKEESEFLKQKIERITETMDIRYVSTMEFRKQYEITLLEISKIHDKVMLKITELEGRVAMLGGKQ